MNKNIIDTIYEKMPHMSQTDKKISEVVLRNPQKNSGFHNFRIIQVSAGERCFCISFL